MATKEEWQRLLEAIHDDAFADLQDLVGPDLPFDAYWEDEEEQGAGYTGGSVAEQFVLHSVSKPLLEVQVPAQKERL